MKKIIYVILFLFILFQPVAILAVEVAPRISDREIIEKLAGLEAGQKALHSEIKLGQDALRSEMNQRFEALENQYDRIWNLILMVLAGIMGLIGFIIWDRKTASQPLEKKILGKLFRSRSLSTLLIFLSSSPTT